MIGLDTNILIRVFAMDDAVQNAKANALLDSLTAENPGWISIACLLELVWVTGSTYQADRNKVCQLIRSLLGIEQIILENLVAVRWALRQYEGSNADFADCLISALGRNAGCTHTLTFDRKAAKSAGMTLVP